MLQGKLCTPLIVNIDRAQVGHWFPWLAIYYHHCGKTLDLLLQDFRWQPGTAQDDSLDILLPEGTEPRRFPDRLLICIYQENAIPVLVGSIFNSPGDLGKKGICIIRNHQPNRCSAAGS